MHSSPQPYFSETPAAAVAGGRGPSEPDDLALGWECADPALQIERWRQEAQPQLPGEG
jgi:hypothetical protein